MDDIRDKLLPDTDENTIANEWKNSEKNSKRPQMRRTLKKVNKRDKIKSFNKKGKILCRTFIEVCLKKAFKRGFA